MTDHQSSPDIVQRLRNFCVWNNRQSHYEPVPLTQEAATEIEQLRAARCSAGTEDTKTVYVKRWRTLVKLPTKYADEIVEALRDPAQPSDMREALIRVAASLAAAISILERTPSAKKAAPSNTMFEMMLSDYRKALEFGRTALAMTSTDRGTEK